MKSNRACQNCGKTQGPFDKEFVGFRKTGRWIFTCHVPVRYIDGRRIPDAKRAETAKACTDRRSKRDVTAQTHHPAGG